MMSADLVIANGLGLEEGVLANVNAAADAGVQTLEIGPRVDPIPFGSTAGDDQGDLDPHVWTDPDRMAIASRLIEHELSELAPAAARDELERIADSYVAALGALTDEIESRVAALPAERRRLVTNHNVFGYFADRFGFEVIGSVLPSGTTLASPSAADLAELAETIEQAGVPAIFADSSQPDRLAQVLASEAATHVAVISLHTESLGPPGSGADTYVGMMRSNVDIIIEALGTGT
jgi:zinc/manganese transport system substrate-binding protein